MAVSDRPYLAKIRQKLERAGLAGEFDYRGALDRNQKLSFLRNLDILSVPTTFNESKGFSVLEAMASAVPVVQPRKGSFPEILEKTGGGLLVSPDDPESLAEGLYRLWEDAPLRASLGRQGYNGVRAHYTIQHSAHRLLKVYGQQLASTHAPQ
jgi:glycosyltransferase involved in cell wall biosynthesis